MQLTHAPLRLSRHVSVPAFGRCDETSGLVARSIVLTPHQNGPRFSVQLRALPLDGRIVLPPPDQNDTTPEDRHRDR